MLKGGVLEGPFTQKPEAGILKTLPSYMVNIDIATLTKLLYSVLMEIHKK